MSLITIKYSASMCQIALCLFLMSGCNNPNKGPVKISYYDDGKIKSIKSYKNKILNGECIWFYPNGFIESKLKYIDGKTQGDAYYFYKSGALKTHCFWNDNKTVGFANRFWDDTLGIIKTTVFYDSSGQIVYEKNFDQHGYTISEKGLKPN